MTPKRNREATINLKHPGLRDLPIARSGPYLISEWEPSAEERARIALGGNIYVGLLSSVHPPLAVFLKPEYTCNHCGAEIEGADRPAHRRDDAGNTYHAACWQARHDELTGELEEFMADNPNYTEVAPGRYEPTPEYLAEQKRDEAEARMAIGHIAVKMLEHPGEADAGYDPVLIRDAIDFLCRTAPAAVKHAVNLAKAAKQQRTTAR